VTFLDPFKYKPETNRALVNNPIRRDRVDHIEFRVGKPGLGADTGFTAKIWFYDGNTFARHQIDAPSFEDLIASTNAYVEALP
jgi:hypothetical protein